MIYMKNSTNCTQLDKNYDLKIQSMEEQITKLKRHLYDKNPLVIEKKCSNIRNDIECF